MITRTKIDLWCEAVIEAGWLAALVVAPLFFNVFSSRVFEPDKVSLIRTIMLVMLLAWLVKLANGGSVWSPAARTDDADAHTAAPRGLWRIPFLLPILLLVTAYSISTLLSVAPFVSWWGSYQRLQGTYTFFSYVLIALLTMAHLRTADQIRRLQHAVISTSLPIAIYGVIQHMGIDPLPWGGDVTVRIAANAGNAIFLAAYLLMAVFLTLERIYSSFAYLLSDTANVERKLDLPSTLAGGAYLFVLLVQLLAIFWTQSRGPWLGLLSAIFVFMLLALSALRPRHYRQLLGGWIGLGLLGILAIILMNTTSLFGGLSSVPYVGRLTQLLDQGSRTAQVRILIWQGASEMVVPHDPLIYPDGTTDAINPIRPLVGYGPEAMWVAYNRFYPPPLAYVESRNASPDRSHNESWDALVISGLFGFVAYMSLFISIFYWALRWLGLLVNRRDKVLFGALLAVLSSLLVIIFYLYDGSWRYLGVAVPAGLAVGLVLYIMAAPFLHPDLLLTPADRPRQLLLVAILATMVGHFVEIHFGIAIASTRTHFWILTALLLVLGMRWATVEPFAANQEAGAGAGELPSSGDKGKRRRVSQKALPPGAALPLFPITMATDLLIFLTFVFIYTTNTLGKTDPVQILLSSFTARVVNGREVSNLALLFLLFFTWIVIATLGLAGAALRKSDGAPLVWWLRGYALHGATAAGLWLVYGLYHARRLIPGIGGDDLDSQLNQVANHFAHYTWLLIGWLLVTATFYVWPVLREQGVQAGRRRVLAAVGAVVAAILLFFVVRDVTTALVRADVIYKQGQQFDSQGNWLSSVELYRRALAARTTEDQYMLFLGRALLEQARQTQPEGETKLPAAPTLADVLALTPTDVSQMARQDILRAAEVVLRQAQKVNPLNTDHTANLARLYRAWSDLSPDDSALSQTMLDNSIAQYNVAVILSPHAAHLWNEKGNAHLARRERDLAEAAYRHSLEIDPLYDQTYLLLADLWDNQKRYTEAIRLLEDGIAKLDVSPRHRPTAAMYSYLGVTQAHDGDLAGAIQSNLKVLEIDSANVSGMRNLALLYRDAGDSDEAVRYAEATVAATAPARVNELVQLRQLLVELYSQQGKQAEVIAQYEAMRQLAPTDPVVLENLGAAYVKATDWNKAAEAFQSLMALEPDDYHHPYALAQILAQVGQVDNARTLAEQALALAPPDAQADIAALLDQLGMGE